MKYALVAIVPAVFLLTAGFMSAGCNTGNGVAGGGDGTAGFFSEIEMLHMKMAECAPGGELFDWDLPGNTLPILDGLDAIMAEELHGNIEYANIALSCGEFFKALNSDVTPEACETPGRTCSDDVVHACLPGRDGNVRIDIDCAAMDLKCLDGRCTLGLCQTNQCDDDTLVSCDDMSIRHEFRCGSLGLSCGYGESAFQCTGTGLQCSTTTMSPSCATNILTWCLGGKIATLDCGKVTDGRRECNQSWLDNNPDVESGALVTTWLDKVCSQKYAECDDGVTMCSEEGEAQFCRDGIYEYVYCPFYGFEACTPPGGDNAKAACTGLVEVVGE